VLCPIFSKIFLPNSHKTGGPHINIKVSSSTIGKQDLAKSSEKYPVNPVQSGSGLSIKKCKFNLKLVLTIEKFQ